MDLSVLLIVFFGLLFDYTNGFHDSANVVSTVIATRALAPFSAIVLAGILNFIGATQISGVATTIATGIVDPQDASQWVVLCAVIGAILWNLTTWYWALPSSSSYSLIGALIGSAWVHGGQGGILWGGVVYKVLLPMIFSPLIGFFLSFMLMKLLHFWISPHFSQRTSTLFRHLQIGSASLIALSHGMNDAQKSMGLITLGLFTGGYLTTPQIPLWVILSCAMFMGLGTAFGGRRIIHTLAYSITDLHPEQGFVAESCSSLVILGASFIGMPVSSTQMISGGVAGVGAAKNWKAVRWHVPRNMLIAWLITLPAAGGFGAALYSLFSLLRHRLLLQA